MIIGIPAWLKNGAGGFQMLKVVEQAFIESGGGLDNYVEGVEYGVEKGWFELSGVELILTEAGVKQMKRASPS